ncbi:MAG: hypothetical protein L0H41_10035 [Microlunatus sp.]|nr:hypothetical protein [Microlunatus sp.]
MANEQGNTTDDQIATGSPFTRPGFLISAVLVVVIVVLGVVVAVRVAGDNSSTTPPPASTSPAASASSTSAGPDASVCGLPAGTETGPLTSPPAVTWDYQGTIAYPKSPEFGAGKTATEGYRYCFQHSAAGAVVMAANALAQGSDPQMGESWAEYVLGTGRYRDQLADEIGAATGAEGSRLKVAGFRVLSYDGATARVDLGVQGSSQNQTLTVSGVYELVWQNGDWKISADVEHPLDISTIPDLTGYVPWGE